MFLLSNICIRIIPIKCYDKNTTFSLNILQMFREFVKSLTNTEFLKTIKK